MRFHEKLLLKINLPPRGVILPIRLRFCPALADKICTFSLGGEQRMPSGPLILATALKSGIQGPKAAAHFVSFSHL